VQYLIMQLSEENFSRGFTALAQIVLVHAAINGIGTC
jgi:hypothetical protein